MSQPPSEQNANKDIDVDKDVNANGDMDIDKHMDVDTEIEEIHKDLDKNIKDTDRADDSLTSDGTEDILNLKYAEICQEGFDSINFLELLMERASAAGHTEEVCKRDLRTLAVVATMRGFTLNELMEFSSKELHEFLKEVQPIYKIISEKPSTNCDVTLYRIAGIFTGSIVKSIESLNNIPITVPAESITLDFPSFMCVPTFGTLIPGNDSMIPEHSSLLMRAFAESLHQFDLITTCHVESIKFCTRQEILECIKMQMESTFYSLEKKVDILSGIGLIEKSDQVWSIAAEYLTAIEGAAAKWDKHDSSW